MTSKLLEQKLPCPVCPSSDAFHRYDDGHGYCFSCQAYVPPEGGLKDDLVYTYEYLPWRGITAATMRHYGVKTKVGSDGKPISLGYPYMNDCFKIRFLDRKEFYTQGDIGKAGLFGRDRFAAGSQKHVTITEGEADALSLFQTLGSPVVSVQSSSSALRDAGTDRAWLNSFERIYLAFDGDEPGREAAAAVAKLFDFNRVYQVKFTNRKDANEYLVAGEQEELRNIWWNSKKYLPESVISSFSEFRKILKEEPKWGLAYPFPTLNAMTYGIRPSESVLITAPEGVGKTELMHAIQYQILKETNDAVAAIYLEEPKLRHLQAMAGLHLGKPAHLPDSGVSAAEISTAVEDLVKQDDRLHLYSHFGSDDAEVLLDTIRFLVTARSCRFVMLDHITMAVSGLAGEDERRALDYLATRLEMMVKELSFALIMVSHVNDYGQTRGSRLISKICDIRIDLSRDVLSPDPLVQGTLKMMLSKNRPIGKTGPAGNLFFDSRTQKMTEIVNAEAVENNSGITVLDAA